MTAQEKRIAKYHTWSDWLQFSTIGGVFLMIVVLDILPPHESYFWVWVFAGVLITLATVSFFVSRKALKLQTDYFTDDLDRIKNEFR